MPPVRRGPGEKPKDLTGTLRRLLGTMGKFRAAFIAVLVFAMLSTIFNIAGPRSWPRPPRPWPPAGMP